MTTQTATEATPRENSALATIQRLQTRLNAEIIGQKTLVERLLIALLTGGHVLVEGAPGLAKTRAIKALAAGLEADFHRIQFTPDLLPADLTGSDVYRPEDGSFRFQQGPIFHNLLLCLELFIGRILLQALKGFLLHGSIVNHLNAQHVNYSW